MRAQDKLVPDPVEYSDWFDNRATEIKRMQAVGTRRYLDLRGKLGREPVYADLVDPQTGKLVPADRLKAETDAEHTARRDEALALFAQRREEIKQVQTFGFLWPDSQPAPAPAPPPKPSPPRPPWNPIAPPPNLPIGQRIAANFGTVQKIEAIAKVQRKVEHLQHKVDQHAVRLDAMFQQLGRGTPAQDARVTKKMEREEKKHNKAMQNWRAAATAANDQAHAAIRVKAPAPVTIRKAGHKVIGQRIDEAKAFLDQVLAGKPGEALKVKVNKITGRAHYRPSSGVVALAPHNPTRVAVHELGHAIETQMPGALKAAQNFLAHRVGAEPLKSLRQLYGRGYGVNEMGREDDFGKHFKDRREALYVGKHYAGGWTEVISMGLEALYSDPIGFAQADPEYCGFILGILDGSLR